jgi:hypothetical protein
MSHHEPRSRVTLEDLLRLKRAERPDPEFWNKFEVELRQKQLAALVERRRWWQDLPQLFARRAYVPIGAAAVLTFTVVSVRNYTPTTVGPGESVSTVSIAAETAAIPSMIAAVAEQAPVEVVVPTTEPAAPVARTEVRLSERMPAQTEGLVPWSAPAPDSPSARSIARNLAKLEQLEPELVNALLPGRMSDTHSVQEAALSLAETAAVGAFANRRNRVLAQMSERQFTQDPVAPEVVRERLARRLGDTDLAGGWTRVGLKADRVSLKF